MYKAIKNIGEYRVGDEVPESKAKVWLEMYSTPHVEKIEEFEKKEIIEEKKAVNKSNNSNVMLDDYLARNAKVVKKNVEIDNLDKLQLSELLNSEENNKNRRSVIISIKNKLKNLK